MRKFLLLLGILVVTIVGIEVLAISRDFVVSDYSQKTIVVKNNQTLWEIASQLHNGQYNNHLVINEIEKLNNLDSIIIYPGQKLVVPVLKEVK